MQLKKLQELIRKFVKEQTGTGVGGGNAGDGNNITSPRPFVDDVEELKNYMYKSIYGGDGGHYKNEPAFDNPNRARITPYTEMNKSNKRKLPEQAYGHATLTTQGQRKKRYATKTGNEPGILENPNEEVVAGKEITIAEDGLEAAIDFISYALETDQMAISMTRRLDREILMKYNISDKFEFPKNLKEFKPFIEKMTEEEAEEFGVVINKFHSDLKRKNIKGYTPKHSDKEELQEQEAADPDQKAYEIGLKRLQKGVIQYQLKYIEKQKSKAMAQAATAGQQASKGFDEQIQALKDQIQAIDNPPEQEQNESLLESYINSRKNISLMTHMDVYKQTVLLESTMKKLFNRFEKGQTNEEILQYYAKKGISMPEQFLSKTRKQFENLKKQKLEIEFSEQEAKDIVTIPTKVPNVAMFDLEDEDKQIATGIYQEKTETKPNKNK